MAVQSCCDGAELLLIASSGNIDKGRSQVEMRCDMTAVATTSNLRMIDDERHMDIVLVHKATLTLQTMLALHLAMVGGVDDDGVLHQTSLLEIVQESEHVVILILDGVVVIVAEGMPTLFRCGRWSNPCLPLTVVVLMGSRASGLIERLVP